MNGKLIANIVSVLLLANAILSVAATQLTTLSAQYPFMGKWAGYSILVSAFLTPFLPRVQQIVATYCEAQSAGDTVSDTKTGAPPDA